jgi:protocatechuate 3,4-dioxygenase beta subunit
MSLPTHPTLNRRRLMSGTLALGATSLLLPVPARAQSQAPSRVITPAQTAGPYYPESFPADFDEDLVRLRGLDARAAGTVTHIRGRVLSLDGRPIAGAQVEIWQCDANGRYLHPRDRGAKPRDTAFQGYSRTLAEPTGATASGPFARSPILAARRTSTLRSHRRVGAASLRRCMWLVSR